MKDYLNNIIKRKTEELNELEQRNASTDNIEEMRAIAKKVPQVLAEKAEAESQLRSLEQKEIESRNTLNPVASYGQVAKTEVREENKFASLEYRKAFKDFVQRGVIPPAEFRAGGDVGTTVTGDITAIVPETILNEFVRDVQKKYGQVYSKVRKLNVKGGVKIPIAQLSANFHWIGETEVSDKQKAGDIKEFVEFSYNEGEVRVAQSFLSQVVALEAFEAEIVKIMVEAFVKAMDNGILAGSGTNQLLGITNDPRVTNVVTLTDTEFSDWAAWRKKLFAKVPLSKRGQGEFLFTPATTETYLLSMKDKNDRPLFREATDLTMGNDAGSFFGRSVTLVEPDVIKDFADATAGDVVGIFWVPQDYAINTNFAWTMYRYFDHATNEWINKAIVVVDGKIVDPSGCYIIKKGA